jgi:1,4-alpha-glucan branching enzyme
MHWDQDEIKAVTPGDFLDSGIPIQIQQPTASSWGENGYYKVWLNEGRIPGCTRTSTTPNAA